MLDINCAKYMRLIVTAGLAVLALAPKISDAVPICIDDLCFEVPIPDTYQVRMADLNADGRSDLYVTGSSTKRAVADFAMLQGASLTFSLVPAPSQQQQQLGMAGTPTTIDVYRGDLSGDGLFDFQFENVDKWIQNAPDLTVLTSRFSGQTPAKIIPNDRGFLDFVDEIEYVLRNIDYFENIYRGSVCGLITYYVPVYVGNPYGYSWSADFSSTGSSYTYYGGYTWLLVQQQVCVPGSALFAPAGQTFFNALATATGQVEMLGQLFENNWLERVLIDIKRRHPEAFAKIVLGAQVLRVTAKAARSYRRVAVATAIVLAADDVTVVGVANDFLIPVIGVAVGTSFVLDGAVAVLDSAINAANRADVGPLNDGRQTEGPVLNAAGTGAKSADEMTNEEYQSVARKWAIPTNCRPSDPNIQQTDGPGDADILRKNLGKAGCGCPDKSNGSSAAHHVVQKGTGPNIPRKAIDSQGILARCQINIDNAVNGVCLPRDMNADTGALRHAGQEGTVHGDIPQGKINDLLRGALMESGDNPDSTCSAAGREKVIRVLRKLAKDYTVGKGP